MTNVLRELKGFVLLLMLLFTCSGVFSQTITTGSVSTTSLCAGATINVPYTSNSVTFTAGNVFTVQLSADATFSSPLSLTPTFTSTTASGTLNNVVIPSNTPTGTTYRVRVVSSTPSITGSNNGADITVTAPTISAPTFTGTTFCQGNSFNVTFSKTCNFYNTPTANAFTVELSNAAGVFPATPNVIGTLASINAGTFTATIPAGTTAGTGYRIRIAGSNPNIKGPDNGTNLTVVAPPGDPTVFGNGFWNVYAYVANNFTNYAGFYTENNLNFNTTSRWGIATSPSNADASSGLAYSGCPITNNSSYSFIHKRTNFPCGYYQIDIPTHDDVVTIRINGSQVYTAGCCTANLNNVWRGFLNASSTIEVQTQNNATNSNQSITIAAAPNPLTTSPPPTICSGASATLTVSSSLTLSYVWSPGGMTGASVSVNPTASTTYTVTGTDATTGCTVSTTLPVTVTAAGSTPVITTTTTQATICSGITTSTITATGANTYTWSSSPSDPSLTTLNANGSSVSINPTGTPPGPTTYVYTVTGNNGCNTASTTRSITVQNIPPTPDPATFGNGTWNAYVYNGTAITSSAYYGYYTESNLSFNTTSRWAPASGPSAATAAAGPPASLGYAGCTVAVPWTVSFKRTNIPCGYYQIDMPAHDDNIALLIDGVQVYTQGYTATSIANIWTGFIGPSTTVEFQLVNTGGPGNLQISFGASPASPLAVNTPITVCPSPNNQITLTATSALAGATYTWANGNASNNGTITSPSSASTTAFPNVSDTYTATLTDAARTGCTASLGVPVTVNPVPATAVTPTSGSTFCPGTSFTLTASGASTYTWTASPSGATAGLSSSTGFQVTATPTVTTTYTVSGSTNCPPPVNASVTITVNSLPALNTFPANTWNVYGFNSTTIGTNYVGYYTDDGTTSGVNAYSFNTQTRWNSGAAPSTANATGGTAWQGCAMNNANISLSFKRSGFACGIYQLDVQGHDDDFLLFINGTQVAQHAGCCDSHTNIWTGALSATSTVEWQLKQGGGGSYLQVLFTKQAITQNAWMGGVSTDWFDANNWCGVVPTTTTDALIPAAGQLFMPVIGAGGAVSRNITISGAVPAGTFTQALPAASLTIAGSNTYDVYGNWVNNGTFTANTSQVTLLGTSSTMSSTSSETFYDLVINKTAGNTLTISSGTHRISRSMTLTQGIINQNGILEFLNGSSAVGANNASYVDGVVTKTGNNAFTFPVGKGGLYRPIGISAPAVATDSYTAQYFNTTPTGTYPNAQRDPTIDHISGAEYWQLNRIAGSSGVNVTLSWNTNSGGVGNLPSLRVAGWNGSLWKDLGRSGTTGNTTSGTVTSATTPLVTTFGPFTLATTDNGNALPIQLTSFNCLLNANGTVSLTWKTSSEINSDYFLVERSDDRNQFTTLVRMKAAGLSNEEISYAAEDEAPYYGKTYYRIREVDFDGKEFFSEVCFVLNERINEDAYPNPADGEVYINLKGEDVSTVSVSNSIGIVVKTPVKITANKITVATSSLPDGLYILRAVVNKKLVKYKMVIAH